MTLSHSQSQESDIAFDLTERLISKSFGLFALSFFCVSTSLYHSTMASKQIVVVSGLGNATGTGASCARLFAREGYLVALVSRPRQEVDELTKEINQAGGTVSTFSLFLALFDRLLRHPQIWWGSKGEFFGVDEYSYASMIDVFKRVQEKWKDARIKCAI